MRIKNVSKKKQTNEKTEWRETKGWWKREVNEYCNKREKTKKIEVDSGRKCRRGKWRKYMQEEREGD